MHSYFLKFSKLISHIPKDRRKAWQPTPVVLPGGIPWTEEPGGLPSMGLQRAGHDRETKQQQHDFYSCFLNLFILIGG